MQFLYADGTDAHFMDSESYEQLAVPEDQVGESLKWIVPNEEVEMLYVDERAERRPGAERRRADRDRDRAGRAAATPPPAAATSPPRSSPASSVARAAVRQRGRPGARGHPLRRVRLARLSGVRRTDQRRAAVVALYQADVTGRPADELLERDASAVHARAGGRASSRDREPSSTS